MRSSGARAWVLPALLVAAAIGVGWAVGGVAPEVWAEALAGQGWAGVPLFVAAYVVSAVLLLPSAVLSVAAGLLWGPVGGVLVVVPASWVGALAAFALGRGGPRSWVESRLASRPRLLAWDRAAAEGGLRLVILLRLAPWVPYNVLNYLLALSPVSWRDYALGSAVGMFPGTVVYVGFGAWAASAGELGQGTGGWVRWTAQAAGLLAGLGATWWLGQRAQAMLGAEGAR